MAWDGKTISYYEHDQKKLLTLPAGWVALTVEWTLYWMRFWFRILPMLPLALVYKILGIKPRGNASSQ